MTLSEIISTFREAHDYTMQEFAAKCGLSKGYISMLEKGVQPRNKKKIVPSIKTIAKIASGMGISPDELVSQLDDNQPIFVGHEASAPAVLSPNELELVTYCHQLNTEGQLKLLDYASDLVASGRYKKARRGDNPADVSMDA